MIPLVACGLDPDRWIIVAVLMALIAIVIGRIAQMWVSPMGKWAAFASVVAVGVMVPVLMYGGLWPFYSDWNYECGSTPDPNLWVVLSGLAFPFLATGSFVFFRSRNLP